MHTSKKQCWNDINNFDTQESKKPLNGVEKNVFPWLSKTSPEYNKLMSKQHG